MSAFRHPKTAEEALARWDGGDTVFTVEMGGFGPGYEQAIQVLVFELIRDNAGNPLRKTKAKMSKWGDATVSRIDKQMGGYSGAMVGAAKNLAWRAIADGWEKMLGTVASERHIQVQKNFPKLEATT